MRRAIKAAPNFTGAKKINRLVLTNKSIRPISVNLPLGGFGISRYTFDYLLYSKKGADLAVLQQEIAWEPTSSSDWKKEYVSLTDISGFPNVRIGLEVVNENGNNIYLDNFEFFVADEEHKVWIENTMSVYPNPAVDFIDVTFNFNIQEAVSIRLFSINGNKVFEQTYERTLNQTYRLSNLSLENGLYILHVGGQYTDLTGKVYVKR